MFSFINNKKELSILIKEPILFLTLPFAFFLMIFFFFIKKILLIRFGFVHSDRIGHFAANTELYLCQKKKFEKKKNTLDLFYFPTKPCNSQLAKMIQRKLSFYPKILIRPFCLISRKLEFLKDHITGRTLKSDHDIKNLYEAYPTQIEFSNKEISYGNKILKKINPSNKPIILLIVRDETYLKSLTKGNSFSYHDHRDDDISRYKNLIEHITKSGYFVIRMGKVVKKKTNIKNKNFLDYPFSKFKNDFMDIFLGFKCKLCISNVTGYDAVPTIFRRPLLFLGSIPIGFMLTSSSRFINTFYDHYSINLKRNLTLEEIFKYKLDDKFKANDFKKNRVKLVKFSNRKMKELFDETIFYINNNYKIERKSKKLNNKFKKIYIQKLKKYSSNTSFQHHGKIKSYFPKAWLKNKIFLLK